VLFSAEVQQQIDGVLGGLSPKEKAAFVLRHFEGMSIEEISRTMGLRSDAAKNNIFRAVKKLRKALTPLMSVAR
jgi:RNA polymerase sigma-70 factor, ECF subfamily